MTPEYTNKFAISNTSIQDWKKMPPKKWHDTWITKTLKRPRRPATVLGSLTDCLAFTPKDIEKRFIVSTVDKPSEKVEIILLDLFDHITLLNKNAKELNDKPETKKKVPFKKYDLTDKGLVISFCQKHDYFKKQPDRAYDDVVKKGEAYLEFLKTTKGRTVITPDDNISAVQLKEILFTNPVSKPFFEPKKNCEVIFQQHIFSEFEIGGYENVQFLPVKGAVDILHFNHKRKEVREVDLKVTDDAFTFMITVKLFDYPGQHSFYDFLIKQWLKTYLDGKYADYSVQNPLNVVIDNDTKIPYIYAYNMDDLHIKRVGIEGTNIKGWEDILNEIAFHINKNDWTRPKEHILNGFINIKIFNKR